MNNYRLKYWNKENQQEVTPQMIKKIEKTINSPLPEDYKQFLRREGGKLYLNLNTVAVEEDHEKEEYSVITLDDIDSVMRSWEYIKDYAPLKQFLPIGSTLEESTWVLSLRKKSYGFVYLLHPDLSKSFIAASFDDFLAQIHFSNKILFSLHQN